MTKLIEKLSEIWCCLSSHPPFELYRCVCQALAVLHYTQRDYWKSAFYLTESQTITFSHKSHLASAQRKRYVCVFLHGTFIFIEKYTYTCPTMQSPLPVCSLENTLCYFSQLLKKSKSLTLSTNQRSNSKIIL